MKTTLEKKNTLFEYLEILGDGYETGDFSMLLPHLAKDCVFESQWVTTPNTGYDEIAEYLFEKGSPLQRKKAFSSCDIMELTGSVKNAEIHINDSAPKDCTGLEYEAGELCLLLEQETEEEEEEKISVIVRIQLNDDDAIKRIDLRDPALFQYRCFFTYVSLFPVIDDETFSKGKVRISEPYYPELSLFLNLEGFGFDEYYNQNIPMPVWIGCLERWKVFYSCNSFDEAFEKICGIDYGTFSVKEEFARRILSDKGYYMWQNRLNNGNTIDQIIEWTNRYKDRCEAIYTYGI